MQNASNGILVLVLNYELQNTTSGPMRLNPGLRGGKRANTTKNLFMINKQKNAHRVHVWATCVLRHTPNNKWWIRLLTIKLGNQT